MKIYYGLQEPNFYIDSKPSKSIKKVFGENNKIERSKHKAADCQFHLKIISAQGHLSVRISKDT